MQLGEFPCQQGMDEARLANPVVSPARDDNAKRETEKGTTQS